MNLGKGHWLDSHRVTRFLSLIFFAFFPFLLPLYYWFLRKFSSVKLEMIILQSSMWESNHWSFPHKDWISPKTEWKKTRKGIKPYLSHFFLCFLSSEDHQYLYTDLGSRFLWLSSPCQGRWGGPWKTLWRLVVGGSQGVWWPFHYSRSLPFHACPFPPSFPAEHLHRERKYIGKGEAERVKLPTAV